MANTIVYGNNGFSILFDAGTAYDGILRFPSGIQIESISMLPTATDDILIIRDVDASGRFIFNEIAATAYDSKIKYFNTEVSNKLTIPYVVGAEASAGVIMIIETK